MATRARVVNVSVEYVDHETGLWCGTCMLSTGARFWVALRQGERMHLQERLWCYEHRGGRGVEHPTTGVG